MLFRLDTRRVLFILYHYLCILVRYLPIFVHLAMFAIPVCTALLAKTIYSRVCYGPAGPLSISPVVSLF